MRFFELARRCLAITAFSLVAQDATAVTTYASIYGYNQGVQYNWYNNDIMYDSSGTYVNASGETCWGTMGARVDRGAGTIESNAYGLIFRDYCVAGGATCNTGGGGMIAMMDTFTLSGVGDITFFMDITGTSHGHEAANTSAASMSMYARDAVSPGRGPIVQSGERKAAPELGPNAFKYDRLELNPRGCLWSTLHVYCSLDAACGCLRIHGYAGLFVGRITEHEIATRRRGNQRRGHHVCLWFLSGHKVGPNRRGSDCACAPPCIRGGTAGGAWSFGVGAASACGGKTSARLSPLRGRHRPHTLAAQPPEHEICAAQPPSSCPSPSC